MFAGSQIAGVLENTLIAAAGSNMTSLAQELAAKTDQDGAWYLPDKWSEDMKDENGQPMSKRQDMQYVDICLSQ